LIDGYSEIQMTVQYMSMDFGWDGSDHFIMAVYIPVNAQQQIQILDFLNAIAVSTRQTRDVLAMLAETDTGDSLFTDFDPQNVTDGSVDASPQN
jgi:hypothetical protein